MANVAKYRAAGCGHMFKHYERAQELNEETGELEYVRFRNQNIDISKSHLNYNLAPARYDENGKEMSQLEIMHRRLKDEDVYFRKRKDTNVMCSCVITKPKTLPNEESERFFKTAYTALAARYGEANVISAYVHKDENEDHMHFSFVPVAFDAKRQRLTVSAKMKISRSDLQTLHPYLTAELKKEFGYDVGIENGATKEGNVTVSQLKNQTARASELEAQNDLLQKQVEELEKKAEKYEAKIDDSEKLLKALYLRFKSLLRKLKELVSQVDKMDTALDFFKYKAEEYYPPGVFYQSQEYEAFLDHLEFREKSPFSKAVDSLISEAEAMSFEIEEHLKIRKNVEKEKYYD